MITLYRYIFADGSTITISHPLEFSDLKIVIDTHGALVKCYKKAVIVA